MQYIISLIFLFVSIISYSATPINQVVVFGDSLSDNGNLYEYLDHQLPVSPPYYQGRFSNGPVWIELLMKQLYPINAQAHLSDYAFGGSGISTDENDNFSLNNQIKKYLTDNNGLASSGALYVVWIGANNYFNLPDNQNEAIESVINGIRINIEELVNLGAKHFLILNLPNLGRIPAAIEFDARDELGFLSLEHNLQLRQLITDLRLKYPEVQFIDYNITEILDDIIDHPKNYGFSNSTATCSDLDDDEEPQTSQLSKSLFLATIDRQKMLTKDKCYGYLFFDLYHPTAHAHEILSAEISKELMSLDLEFV